MRENKAVIQKLLTTSSLDSLSELTIYFSSFAHNQVLTTNGLSFLFALFYTSLIIFFVSVSVLLCTCKLQLARNEQQQQAQV